MGHSWGGRLAMEYAIKYQEHVESLVLISSGDASPKGWDALSAEFQKRAMTMQADANQLFGKDPFEKLTESQITALYRKIVSVFFYDPKNADCLTLNFNRHSFCSSMTVRELMAPALASDITNQLKSLTAHTLLVHGAEDIIPFSVAMELHQLIAGSTLVKIPDCGHFPYIEAPTILFSEIERFLESEK